MRNEDYWGDTNWNDNPTQTKLQEVIFDLYDVYEGKITKLSREYAKELAMKLEEVEERIFNPRNRPDDILDMSIRIMDKLWEMKILNEKQSRDEDFAIQDAITNEIELVFNRMSKKDQIDNNSISIGELDK